MAIKEKLEKRIKGWRMIGDSGMMHMSYLPKAPYLLPEASSHML